MSTFKRTNQNDMWPDGSRVPMYDMKAARTRSKFRSGWAAQVPHKLLLDVPRYRDSAVDPVSSFTLLVLATVLAILPTSRSL